MRDRASPHKAADKWGLAKLSCCNQQNKNNKNKKKLKEKIVTSKIALTAFLVSELQMTSGL